MTERFLRTHRSPNYGPRPAGVRIDCIVIHDSGTEGITSPLDWTSRREAQVGYHYLIGRDGAIYETIDPAQRAWHAGTSELHGRKDVNTFSLGVCFVDSDVAPSPYPLAQLDAGAELCAELCSRYSIPLNRIVGHDMVAPGRKIDPGADFPWREFLIEVGVRLALSGSPIRKRAQQGGAP